MSKTIKIAMLVGVTSTYRVVVEKEYNDELIRSSRGDEMFELCHDRHKIIISSDIELVGYGLVNTDLRLLVERKNENFLKHLGIFDEVTKLLNDHSYYLNN